MMTGSNQRLLQPRSNRALSAMAMVGLLALAVVLAGCADVKPLEYRAVDQIKPGPGLLTGEDGEFVLYGSSRKSVLD
ncbi:hypothetical protein HBA54_00325 [Pelagibius litoralis]|uniref:Uncharacterized protein n=1 Tax=Pelagibius litoralis TaxID=374515 RepID=A0A967C5S1_9PROT|nr:hypothetical protein [Pelagibius litoralis]NIA67032.1 hypothetical protein [Pelagibius litoralis]